MIAVPPEPSLPVMSSVEPVPTYTQADLTLYSNLFSDSSGRIVYYAILLAEDSFHVPPQSGWIDSNTSWPLVDTWSTAYKHSPVSMYQSTPIRWDPFNGILLVLFNYNQCLGTLSFCNEIAVIKLPKKCTVWLTKLCAIIITTSFDILATIIHFGGRPNTLVGLSLIHISISKQMVLLNVSKYKNIQNTN